MYTFALFLSFIALTFAVTDFDRVETNFGQWAKTYNKQYETMTEYYHRLAVFAVNEQRVLELNAQSEGGAVFALNKFADLSASEFKKFYLGYIHTEKTNVSLLELEDVNAPDSFSWISRGKVTAVKDQAQCGSCWAFSATENIESVWMIAKGLTPSDMKPLAPQQIVDCDTSDGGCNGGDTVTAYQYVERAGGLDTEASYPYHAVNQKCQFKPADVFARINGYKYATTTRNENEMKTATATVAPLSICVDAEPWQFYSSGVMTAAQCGTSLDHCVQITGYDTAARPAYWEVRNSWGANWGEKGFIRLEYGTDTCGLAIEATTVTV